MVSVLLYFGIFLGGILVGGAALFYYLGNRRKMKSIPYVFELNDYNSQQLAKLLARRVLEVLQMNSNLCSVDPAILPLSFQSQWNEDVILYYYFKQKTKGLYIEVGAFDGVQLSNTYFFECIGWKGILVEPQLLQYNKCVQNRPNSTCWNVAISPNKGPIKLNIVQDENYATWSFVGDKDKVDFMVKSVMIETRKLKEIIPADVLQIDFLSIDVEGMELEILNTIDFDRISIDVILIEHYSHEIQQYLSRFGYQLVYKTWINYFYSKDIEGFKNTSIWENIDMPILG